MSADLAWTIVQMRAGERITVNEALIGALTKPPRRPTVTAVGGLADRVAGLEGGADDYLVKPFAFSELAARVHALGRRPAAQTEASLLAIGGIELDLHRRTSRATVAGSSCNRASSRCWPS